jgi:hypothetical protein
MYQIEDSLQNNFDFSNISVIKDIMLGLSVYLFYINAESDIFMAFLKMIILLFIVRWLLANITKITDTSAKPKRHFQISGHLIILYTIVFLSIRYNLFNLQDNQNIGWFVVFLYSFFIITTKTNTTSDILFSVLLIHALCSSIA